MPKLLGGSFEEACERAREQSKQYGIYLSVEKKEVESGNYHYVPSIKYDPSYIEGWRKHFHD